MAKANKPTATPAKSTSKTSGKTSGKAAVAAPKATSKAAPAPAPAAKAKAKAPAAAAKASAPAVKAPAKAAAKPAKVSTPAAKAPAKAAAKTSKAPLAADKAPAKAAKSPTKAVKEPSTPAQTTAGRSGTAPAKGVSSTKGSGSTAVTMPAVKGHKDGIAFTKDFDAKFLLRMRAQLLEERVELTGQATRLEDEANALVAEAEMGDVQFDDEGGEGDTMVVERERDLALSAQARQLIVDIDAALLRMQDGSYGYSVLSGRPIPRERLEAIPWADVLVEEKAGGLGRR
jgi:RNA polymerase-binding transcription factor DksA